LVDTRHPIFRAAWWTTNVLFATAIVCLIYSGFREYSVRRYLDGFSDAIVPNALPALPKVEALLSWMRAEPSRATTQHPDDLSPRDPLMTLNYAQLLNVCGTATNAFLNLARSSDLQVRRLLLLDAHRNTKHVVAEVLIDGKWIVVDPTYRIIMRDASGRMLTRADLQKPELFAQATAAAPGYPADYSYERFAHVRITRLPMVGLGLRRVLDWVIPGWEEKADWSLLLERESFFFLFASAMATLLLVLVRAALAWIADSRLHVRRFGLRKYFRRAGVALFSAPEMRQ
jgi:hypothetical protein